MKHLLLALLSLTLWSAARADHRDDDRRGPRVTFYENADFQGDSITLYAGDSLENFGRATLDGGHKANDRISSIRIEGGAEVQIFSDAKYRGETLRLTRDVRNLAEVYFGGSSRSWNDQISSVRVESRRNDRPPSGIYQDVDKVIRRAYQDILLREPDDAGKRDYRIQMIDHGMTEQQLREALRRSDEFRGPVLNGMIDRAYRELLGREPDPRGREHYRNKVIEHDWTDAAIRDDIRHSDEFKRRPKS